MPTLMRFIVFKSPPQQLYTTKDLAEEAAVGFAKNDLGQVWQVWQLNGTRVSRVTATLDAVITPD